MEEIQVTVVDSQEVVSLFVQTSEVSVLSVNSQTGVVTLDPDDLDDTATTNKFTTSANLTKLGFVSVTQAVNLDTMESKIEANVIKVTDEVSTASTGTVLSLTNKEGVLYNMGSANAATTYTTSGTTLNAYVRVLINAASEPTVTGGTKITGSDFVISTNMYMTVWYNGTAVQFWFEEI